MSEYIITCDEETASWIGNEVDSMKPFVRCRDCEHYFESTIDEDGDGEPSWCTHWAHEWVRDDSFCAWGERRSDAE